MHHDLVDTLQLHNVLTHNSAMQYGMRIYMKNSFGASNKTGIRWTKDKFRSFIFKLPFEDNLCNGVSCAIPFALTSAPAVTNRSKIFKSRSKKIKCIEIVASDNSGEIEVYDL